MGVGGTCGMGDWVKGSSATADCVGTSIARSSVSRLIDGAPAVGVGEGDVDTRARWALPEDGPERGGEGAAARREADTPNGSRKSSVTQTRLPVQTTRTPISVNEGLTLFARCSGGAMNACASW